MSNYLAIRRLAHSFILAVPLLSVSADPASKFLSATNDPIPEGWSSGRFEPNFSYPENVESESSEPWLEFDFKTDPVGYALAVFRYAVEGNVEVNWRGQDNVVRQWYHVPWLHYHTNGREFVRGLTRERDSAPGELHANQKRAVQNWGIGFYNSAGGWTIGQVWKDRANPDPTKAMFPDGTVMTKLIFTQATAEEVPHLKDAIEWDANINKDDEMSPRSVQSLRLIQFDFAVRDPRANDTTGWVFGVLVYDGNRPGADPYDRFVPIGLSWGNDPGITTEMIETKEAKLQETILNPESAHLITRHGYGGRMNGLVDNPGSSCLSCHATAQTVPISSMAPPTTLPLDRQMRWFENTPAGQAFDKGETSLDYSLQLAQALRNFYAWKERTEMAEKVLSYPVESRWLHPPAKRNVQTNPSPETSPSQ